MDSRPSSRCRKSTSKDKRNVSRRTFLAGSALTGATAALPGWLTGCGLLPGLDDVTEGPREKRTLHFDFSHLEPGRTYKLHVLRSKSHGAWLKPHTNQSRATFRRNNSLLRQIADGHLTHYIEHVDFPGDALQHYWVSTEGDDGVPALVGTHLHVPHQAYLALANAKRRAVEQGFAREAIDPATHAKLRHFKIKHVSKTGTAQTLSTLNSIVTPMDAAKSIVFHHPEIMNLDPSQAAKVLDVIENLRGSGTSCTGDNVGLLTALACAIAAQGPGTTTGGWMRRVPAVDHEGEPVLDSKGAQIYDNRPSDQTMAAAAPVIKEVLREVYNNPDIRGQRFADSPGITSVGASGPTSAATAKSNRASTTDFDANLTHPAGSIGSNLHGLIFRDFKVTDPDTRSVSLIVENIYLRFLDAYVQFLQADKKTPILDGNGNPEAPRHLAEIPTDNAIMGIPLLDQGTLRKTTLSFDMPESASYANILFGTIGAGGIAVGDRDHFDMNDLITSPMAWTLVINIGVPSFLLALGIGLQGSSLLKSIMSDKIILARIAFILGTVFVTAEATRAQVQGSARGPIVDTANLLIAICIRSIPALSAKLLGYASAEELVEAAPLVGLAVRALGMIGGLAQLGETVGEVLTSPAVFDNTVSFAMDSTVTLRHDPNDFEFPATAKMWIVRATYDGTVVREVCGELPTTQSDPIQVILESVPVGGKVQIDVWFLSGDNWIAGQGGTGHWENLGQPEQRWVPEAIDNLPDVAGDIDFTIHEFKVPLTASTVYSHKEKLGYQGGEHVWVADDPPAATIANLDTTQNNSLHALTGITVSQTAASVGYAWRTGTPAVAACPGESQAATSLQLIQSLSLKQRPNDAFKAPGCGSVDRRAIAYSLMAPLGGTPRNFYVDPVYGPYVIDSATTIPYKYFVRSVVLNSQSDKTPFDASAGQSWGWFNLPSDGIAVHPMGHVASINTANSKLEILHLPGSAVSDAEATCSTMLSGRGSVPGLMLAPVAIAAAPNGALLVLDAGNRRVQAFDTSGNVNNVFRDEAGNPRNYFPLDSSDATCYLDLAVEASAGYVFILYYTGSGNVASDYVLDIYTHQGDWLTRTDGVNVARIALDYWRNLYTLNYETIIGPGGRYEPSISQWIPSTPPGDDPNALSAVNACPK